MLRLYFCSTLSFQLPSDTVTAILQSLDPTPDVDDGVLPVSSGKLLLTSGPNRGDVVKFHRFKCVAFGRSLASADLSYIFHHEEKVNCRTLIHSQVA